MISLMECVKCAGLASNEVVLGAVETKRHEALLSSYLFNLGRGREVVQDMIVSDLRRFLELGALNRASDTFLVLRMFLSRCPKAHACPKQDAAENALEHACEPRPTAASILSFPQPGAMRPRLRLPAPSRRRSGAR